MNKSLIKQNDEQKVTEPARSYIPLSMIQPNIQVTVKLVRCKDDTRKFLSDLGFVQDAVIEVVSRLSGNIIVSVKGTRVGIGSSMANKIMTVAA